MCGLVALFAHHPDAPPIEAGELIAIRDAMTARGPDGMGDWMAPDCRVGLAHRRLAIIDLKPSGAQPMATADGRLVVTYNGEIYNYRELRAELEAQGVRFASESDTEVILHLYRRLGADLVHRLRGMFAFALWDAEKQGLLLARDPFGIKPLYLAEDGRTLRAASQVKALLAGAQAAIDTAPDPAGHAGYFLWGHVPEPFTLYRGIRALPAGSWLWVDAAGARRQERYFDPAGEIAKAEASEHQLLAPALIDSVRHHLVADVPVGVFLSAGRDSTTLAALAAQHLATPLKTITLGFAELEGTGFDEVPLAERMAAHIQSRHATKRITHEDFQANRARLLADMDQPTIDGTNTWFVAKAAREAGLKVALSGLGGDELFQGYDTFTWVPTMAARLGFAQSWPSLGKAARHVLAPWIGRIASPKVAGVLELGGSIAGAYLLRRAMFMPWELARLLDPDLARAGLERLDTMAALERSQGDVRDPAQRVAALEIQWYMKNQLLRDADWAGMAHGLEIRTPLVDVDFFRRILPLSRPKSDMADVPAPPLPAEIRARPKSGFLVPVHEWVRAEQPGERGFRGWAKAVYRGFTGTGA